MGLLRQETQMFAALWVGTLEGMVPEAGDAQMVCDKVFEAAQDAETHPCETPSYRRSMIAQFDEAALGTDHSSWVH